MHVKNGSKDLQNTHKSAAELDGFCNRGGQSSQAAKSGPRTGSLDHHLALDHHRTSAAMRAAALLLTIGQLLASTAAIDPADGWMACASSPLSLLGSPDIFLQCRSDCHVALSEHPGFNLMIQLRRCCRHHPSRGQTHNQAADDVVSLTGRRTVARILQPVVRHGPSGQPGAKARHMRAYLLPTGPCEFSSDLSISAGSSGIAGLWLAYRT